MKAAETVRKRENLKRKHIQVLFIEDSVDDYEVITEKIKRAGFEINSRRVETPEDLKQVLVTSDWDLVISDSSLPRFDGHQALSMTRKTHPHIPFIIISGSIGEEAAGRALLAGANDYMIKDDLTRLIPSIYRELREYENRIERLEMEQKLQQSQRNYQLLAQNVQDLVCVHDTDCNYLWVSPSCSRILGYSPEELISQGVMTTIHPEDLEKVAGVMESLKKGDIRTMQRFKYRRRRKDGIYIYLETLAEPVYENEWLSRIVSTSRDITEQALASQLLEENQARYEGVLQSLAEGVVLLNNEGHVITYNKSAQQILKIPNKDYVELVEMLRHNFQLLRKDEKPMAPEDFPSNATLQTGISQKNTLVGLRKAEEVCWLSVNSVPYSLGPVKKGVILSFIDVTGQNNSQEKIKRVTQELMTLIEKANAPIFGIDWDGNITEWNSYTSKITGYTKKEVVGKNLIRTFILKSHRDVVHQLFKMVLRGKNTTHYELPIVTKSGRIITILFNGTPRRDYTNKITGLVAVGQDITELTEYREKLELKVEERTRELKKALKKEKELVSLKSKFVSMASHEFRTPLATIKFASDFIKMYHNRAEWQSMEAKLDKIDEQVRHMTYLLDDVLVMGKSQAGMIKIHAGPLNLPEFCLKVTEEVRHSTGYTHRIVDNVAAETEHIVTDEKLLRNILVNLLSNAIKFSPASDKVRLEVICQKNMLRVVVQDWGLGIEKKERNKVFEAFHRSDNVRGIQGTGLGLSIVKKAVEVLNGRIDLKSETGSGTTFIVSIPVGYHNEKENTGR